MFRHRRIAHLLTAATIGLVGLAVGTGGVEAGAPRACTLTFTPTSITVYGDDTNAEAFTATATTQGDWVGQTTFWIAVNDDWAQVTTGADFEGAVAESATAGMIIDWLESVLGPLADGDVATLSYAVTDNPSATYDAANIDCSASVEITYRASSAPTTTSSALPGTGGGSGRTSMVALGVLTLGVALMTLVGWRRRTVR